LELLTKIAQ